MESSPSSPEIEIGRINALAARDSYRAPRLHPYIAETLRQYVKSFLVEISDKEQVRVGRAGLIHSDFPVNNDDGLLPKGTPFVRIVVSDNKDMRVAQAALGPISGMDDANWALDWYRPREGSPNFAINIYPSVEDALQYFAETESQ